MVYGTDMNNDDTNNISWTVRPTGYDYISA